jgi:hypothetical protein
MIYILFILVALIIVVLVGYIQFLAINNEDIKIENIALRELIDNIIKKG